MFRKKPPQTMLPPEWVIVGLGNPGPQYRGTRHNVGFELLELLCSSHKIKLDRSKHKAQYGQGMIEGHGVLLVKPLTFMNLSGQAVAPFLQEFGIAPDHVLVVTDDLDLPVGKIRFRTKGSAGGHNGHKSLIQSLGTPEYPRIKIGIGKGQDETIDHVLGRFHPDEFVDVKKCLDRAAKGIAVLVESGADAASLVINTGE